MSSSAMLMAATMIQVLAGPWDITGPVEAQFDTLIPLQQVLHAQSAYFLLAPRFVDVDGKKSPIIDNRMSGLCRYR